MQDTKEIKVGQLVYDPVDKRLGHITEISTVVNKYDDPEGYPEVMYDVEWQDNEYQYEMTIPYYAEDITISPGLCFLTISFVVVATIHILH